MQRNDDAQQHRFTRTILPQEPTAPSPTARPSLSGTGGAITAQAAMNRAQDFAAGKVPLAEYASTLKAPDLAYQNNAISPKPTGPGQMRGLFSAIGETASHVLTPTRVNRSLAVPIEKPVMEPGQPNAPLRALPTAAPQPMQAPSAEVRPVRSVLGSAPSSDAAPVSQQQRDAAGDGEQQVRGTNISAARQPNGTMAFSGAAPTFAAPAFSRSELPRSTDSLAQEFSARADRMRALREESTALRDNLNFNAGGALSRQKTQDEITRDMLTGQSRSGRQAAVQLMEDQQRAGIERQRTAIDQQRADADRMTAEASVNVSRAELDQQRRIRGLQDRLIDEQDPGKRAQFERTLGIISGKDNSGQPQVIYNEELINPEQPMAGTRRVPMLLNRDGTATVVMPRATQDAPDGMRYVGTSNGKPVYEDQNGRRFVQGGN